MEIVDTHQHLWDLDRFPYSWCAGIPRLNRSFRMEDYRAATEGLNVVQSVHVEADVDEPYLLAETRWILSLAESPDNPLQGVVAACRPEREDFRAQLAPIAGHPRLKGLRRVLHTQPDELARTPRFAQNLRLLPEYGLSFDLCVLARQLPLAVELVRACPEVAFVLDHCGVPGVKERALHPWRAQLREIAELPNVACKISGLVAYADPDAWTVDDLRPFVEHSLECFGWDRVMFGSDWPVCLLSATLRAWVDAALELTRGETEENRRKLFSRNARRVYRLGEGVGG